MARHVSNSKHGIQMKGLFSFDIPKWARREGGRPTKKERTAWNSVVSSALSTILSTMLFVGTTLAWYTSNVESKTEQILVGNMVLDIGDYKTTDSGTEWTSYAYKSGDTNNALLTWQLKKATSSTTNDNGTSKVTDATDTWAPGDVGVLTSFYVQNQGTLGVKYKLGISAIDTTVEIPVPATTENPTPTPTSAPTSTTVLDNLQFYLKTETKNGTDTTTTYTPIDIYTLAAEGGLSYEAESTRKSTAGAATSDRYTILCKVNEDLSKEDAQYSGVGGLTVTAYGAQAVNAQELVYSDTIYVTTYEELAEAVDTANKATTPTTIKLGDNILAYDSYTWKQPTGTETITHTYSVDTSSNNAVLASGGQWKTLSFEKSTADTNVNSALNAWIVLDLNGHTLYGQNEFITVSANTTVAITDNASGGTGTIELVGESYTISDADSTDSTSLPDITDYKITALCNVSGRLIITNGIFKDSTTNYQNQSKLSYTESGLTYTYSTPQFEVVNTTENTSGTILISKGTFDWDVTDYVKFSSIATCYDGSATPVKIKKYTDSFYYKVDDDGTWFETVTTTDTEGKTTTDPKSTTRYDFKSCTVAYDTTIETEIKAITTGNTTVTTVSDDS